MLNDRDLYTALQFKGRKPSAKGLGSLFLGDRLKHDKTQFAKAEEHLKEALRLLAMHPVRAKAFDSLAWLYTNNDRRDDGLAVYRRGLAWAEKRFGLVSDEARMLRSRYIRTLKATVEGQYSSDRDENFHKVVDAEFAATIARANAAEQPECVGVLLLDKAGFFADITTRFDEKALPIYRKALWYMKRHKAKVRTKELLEGMIRLSALLERAFDDSNLPERRRLNKAILTLMRKDDTQGYLERSLLKLFAERQEIRMIGLD